MIAVSAGPMSIVRGVSVHRTMIIMRIVSRIVGEVVGDDAVRLQIEGFLDGVERNYVESYDVNCMVARNVIHIS